uniref:NADH-ubiquinone oxidoreductase chain 6 n=1 Tax=Neurothemis fulvia TaxID=342749 RepID=A0A7M1I7L3_9ODON|nr:NADH dehydrogenase subunit 6 [Neurothemis fulvia]QOQ35069.1 NADH dehydrogenase subunit 6 [Neurothemis fulvia]
MSQILSVILMIMNSMMFSYMSHPMNMGVTLLLQTLMMTILMGVMSYTSWFSYILFLVFLGGMLVLFIYMTSIASNELFKKSMYTITIVGMMMITFMVALMILDPFMITNPIMSEAGTGMMKMILSPLYNNPSSWITIFMVLYLFLTLIVIVMITKFNSGPLRPMN